MTRNELIKIGLDASDLPNMTIKGFKEMVYNWHIKPVMKGDKVVGVFYNKNAQVHFSILLEYRRKWFNRSIVREFLKPVFDVYGFILTAVSDSKPYGHDIVKKFGFKEINREGLVTIYRLEVLKWV